MENSSTEARESFYEGMSRMANFFGFPKALGAIFASLYLSEDPLSLSDIAYDTNLTKGSVSTNVRLLHRMNLVNKHIFRGDRKDYYTAETDF